MGDIKQRIIGGTGLVYWSGDCFCTRPLNVPADATGTTLEFYDANHIVTVYKLGYHPEEKEIWERFKNKDWSPAWNHIVDERLIEITNPAFACTIKDKYIPRMEHRSDFKPFVYDWLRKNVKDSTDRYRQDNPVGWNVHKPWPTDDMIPYTTQEVSVFFVRRRDAMNFIKEFSSGLHR